MDAGIVAVVGGEIVMIAGTVGNLRRVRVARSDKAVEVRGRRAAEDLLAAAVFVFRPVAILEKNIEDGRDLRVRRLGAKGGDQTRREES